MRGCPHLVNDTVRQRSSGAVDTLFFCNGSENLLQWHVFGLHFKHTKGSSLYNSSLAILSVYVCNYIIQ